jgi:hypothetical protein
MKKGLPVIVVMGLLALFSNCSKLQHKSIVELDDDTSFTGLYNYKPGSYWIYTDTISGRTDSFFVRANSYIQVGASNQIYDYHKVYVAEHNLDGTNPADSALWVWDFQGYNISLDYYYNVQAIGWKTDVSYNPLFTYPVPLGPIASTSDTASVVAIYNVDTISHIPMSAVVVIRQYAADTTTGTPGTTFDDSFYINDTLGIVQMSLDHPLHAINRFWRLKRYKVVR